jgi:hypothetical protein
VFVPKFNYLKFNLNDPTYLTFFTVQCRQRYLKVIAPGIRKGKWSEEEDALLCLVMNQGMTNWRKIAEKVPGRTSKQCRERWNHYLHPDVVKTPFSASEDKTLAKLYKLYGNHWSAISKVGNTFYCFRDSLD